MTEAYRTSAIVHDDGTVVIGNLPFHKGQRLEVILLEQNKTARDDGTYALRGETVRYIDSFGSIAEDEWENAN